MTTRSGRTYKPNMSNTPPLSNSGLSSQGDSLRQFDTRLAHIIQTLDGWNLQLDEARSKKTDAARKRMCGTL